MAQTVDTYTSSTTWTCPRDVVQLDSIECWGSGGSGGGNTTTSDGGSGGGGGAYAKKNNVAVVPGQVYTITVGAAVNGNAGADGTDGNITQFVNPDSTVVCKADKGLKGLAPVAGTPQAGGLGGITANCVGDTLFRGGNGGAGRDSATGNGGPGGSSAGTAANGTDGPTTWSTTTAAAAPTGGGIGGNGGAASADGSAPASGNGGGGGGSGDTGTRTGGASVAGKMIVTYTRTGLPNNYQGPQAVSAGIISVSEKIK